ncbi:uncharacterized protein LOC129939244 [Eupeodes corollae]|uniref:uncharacterized protein LOC129939244 n=1 Tax=Eupeodes corollae TaxID=290404 RepID=UPI0024913C47|nr:uncharacterized protein LOC129939244 [Eupeodes corollae]
MRMGMSDQRLNLKFVKEVERHELLYNYNLPGYSRKEEVERAWKEVSEAVRLPVSECRERWRNLRTVFIRKKKPSPKGSQNRRKAYYLADAMKFCLPFIKILAPPSFKKLDTDEEVICLKPEKSTDDENENEIENENVKVNPIENENENNSMMDDDICEITQFDQEIEAILPEFFESKSVKKRKIDQISKQTTSSSTNTPVSTSYVQETKSSCSKSEQKEAMRMFLLSLMPEVENFSDSQIKQFKRRIFSVIDEITGISYNNNDPLVNSTM